MPSELHNVFENYASAMLRLSEMVKRANVRIIAFLEILIIRSAVEHYGIPESDIRRVILKKELPHQVQLWNRRKIDIRPLY